jgi:hypothetical protein
MFENKPEYCPFGHQLWPGRAQVSWKPCLCEPAREAAGRGRGMGHVMVACNSCHDELRQTVFFEPLHHSGHQPPGRLGHRTRPPAVTTRVTATAATGGTSTS